MAFAMLSGTCRSRRFQKMLKITISDRSGSTTFALEGRLCGQWAAEASRAWSKLLSHSGEKEIVLDLEGVTFVDHVGEELLASALERGARVRASGVLVSHMVQQFRQKVSRGSTDEREKERRGPY